MRLSVDRPVDRPLSTIDRAVDRTQTESSLLSVGRPGGRPFHATVDRTVDRANPVHVVHTGRPGGRPAFSTGRPCGRPGTSWPASMRRLAPLSSDLYAIFFHLLYLLSPYSCYNNWGSKVINRILAQFSTNPISILNTQFSFSFLFESSFDAYSL